MSFLDAKALVGKLKGKAPVPIGKSGHLPEGDARHSAMRDFHAAHALADHAGMSDALAHFLDLHGAMEPKAGEPDGDEM